MTDIFFFFPTHRFLLLPLFFFYIRGVLKSSWGESCQTQKPRFGFHNREIRQNAVYPNPAEGSTNEFLKTTAYNCYRKLFL